jgi:MFS family permease
MSDSSLNAALSGQQNKTIRTLSAAQVLNGVGISGTVAAGSLLVSSISKSESLAGLAQTTTVLGAAMMALPLAKLTQKGGRRLSLMSGYCVGIVGAILAILGGTHKVLFLMLSGTFLVGAASASGYQARFAAIDLATKENRSKNLSLVVWGSTVGAVAGPNLMQPAGDFAHNLNLPRLVGPYFIAGVSLSLATLVIFFFLKPDPYLTANLSADGMTQKKHETTRAALKHIRSIPRALFAVSAIGVGHLSIVSIMVMTPVHMSHMDVALSVIGIVILLAAATLAGFTPAMKTIPLGIALFLLGLGWSCTLIAGSTFLSESVSIEMKPSSQGASDLVMNLMGALGGAASGLIIGVFSFGWLCLCVGFLVCALGAWSLRIE